MPGLGAPASRVLMGAGGRRPGKPDTRAEIINAARVCFEAEGYAGCSIRAIAAGAAVDPSLVHHYFPGGKPALFTAAMRFGRDPRTVLEGLPEGEGRGTAIVSGFLNFWEGDPPDGGAAFVALAQAMCTSPLIAAAVREFLADRIWSQRFEGDGLRSSLIASQLMGVAWIRYVLRLDPLASASIAEVARLVGPVIDRYSNAPLDELVSDAG